MKRFSLAVPSNIVDLAAIAGFGLVAASALGIQAFWPSWTLPVLGVFLGFYSVQDTKHFLIAGLALLAAKWGLNMVPVFGDLAGDFATQLIRLVAPAMLIVSVRALYTQFRR